MMVNRLLNNVNGRPIDLLWLDHTVFILDGFQRHNTKEQVVTVMIKNINN